jgi:hypothetical protein
VRACLDWAPALLHGMAVSRHDGRGYASAASPLDLVPVAPSRAADPVRSQKASSIVHRLATSCGQPGPRAARSVRTAETRLRPSRGGRASVAGSPMEGTSGAADLALLRGRAGEAALGPGCVRASDTSRAAAFGARRETTRRGALPATSRERVVEGPRAPTLRGGGARAVGSSGAAPSRERRRGSPRFTPRPAWQRRSLQPALQRSHDERCPSGSGRGSARSRALARAHRRGRRGTLSPYAWACPRLAATVQRNRRMRLRPIRPLARETSAGGCRRGGAGPRPRSPWRAALPALGAGTCRPARLRPRLSTRPLGGDGADGLRLLRGLADAGERGERSARAHAGPRSCTRGGDQAVGGRARGSSWLQKSTSGAWSRPKGHGSSPLAPRSRGRAQRAKARRKPGRGGESRQHASSDTGGGLLVIPRATRESGVRARGREHSAMEGVLERCRPSSLTRRRPGRARRPEATGIRQRCRIRRGRKRTSEVMSQPCPAVENTAGGGFGAEEPSIGAPPGLRWTAHANARGLGLGRALGLPFGASRDGRGNGRSWRFAVKRSSTRLAHPACGSVDPPGSRRPPAPAQGESVPTNARRASVALRRGDRESSDPQGARDGSRLQKSVRRIFLVA